MNPSAKRKIKLIRDRGCTACPLHKTAKNVCIMGTGEYRVPVWVLGEAPGRSEDERGKPFVGRAGVLLRTELTRAGLSPHILYFTNVNKCFPNGTPTHDEAKTCRDLYLRKEFDALAPQYILAVGRIPMEAVTAERKITDAAGKLHPCLFNRDTFVFTTFHPAYILRNNGKMGEWQDHLANFATLVNLDQGRLLD